jgi:type VI protein secretion system component Hcp
MAFHGYMSIKGTQQGQIKGQPTPHRGKGMSSSTPIISFDFGLQSPLDASSGSATGKRQHKPFTVTMVAGTAATQLFQAYCNKELLSEVVIEPKPETVVARISLTNATISDSSRFGPGAAPSMGGQGSSQSPGAGSGTPESVVSRISLTSGNISERNRFGAGMTPPMGGQGSGKSSSSGKSKPEPVAERITLTNALITKYASGNSARGSSNGLGLISIEFTCSAISYKPPRG